MRIARSLHWKISRESRGGALLPDILLGNLMAREITGLPGWSRCGRGDLLCVWNLTLEKNALVWFQLHVWNVEVDDIL